MIISEINGGLGNQMFQYACGRALALRNNAPLFLDITTLEKGVTTEHFTARPFELSIFAAPLKIADGRLLRKFFPKSIPGKVYQRIIRGRTIFTEPAFNYNEIPAGRPFFLRGYWQSEKYFEDCAAEIRRNFTFTAPLNAQTQQIASAIPHSTAVSIHVRRGDYVSSPSANSFHGLAGLEYYITAMQLMEQQADNITYYVFSDDPAWVRQHLVKSRTDMQVVDHNTGADSWQDMYLMSLCSHHIIANSSFSWWGAWLNDKPGKLVTAPKQWFANKEKNDQTNDLIAPLWTRL